jgi:hypothetical protein
VEDLTSPVDLEVCNALWIGERLSELAAACLSSFVELGHTVRLHVYEPVKGVPAGVVLADAAAIVPQYRMIRHRGSGSYALFADLFRFELLARGLGLWIDCDVLCVRPLIADKAFVFGYESDTRIGTSVLKLPADSSILADLRAIFTTPNWKPPWNDWKRNLRDDVRYALSSDYGVSAMSWGIAGPRALTYFAGQYSLDDVACPKDVFYPVGFNSASDLSKPEVEIARLITSRTLCIHLWASRIAPRTKEGIPPASFLAAILNGAWRRHIPAAVASATLAR